ncbi:unnamed protein product [Gongylonema pulchrum]|uniref:Transposase n=1 Tax=Gongylonema pulchrum TaxID=637853 RepID=A0A183DKP4_9BILA|nr:unnamed protein product [Gongylonema pulchrum]
MNGVAVETNRPLRYRCTYCERMFHHRKDKVFFVGIASLFWLLVLTKLP